MNNNILPKVCKWFSIGLLVTFLTSYIVSVNPHLSKLIYTNPIPIIIIILELALAIILPLRIRKMNINTAIILYFGYTFLTGLTFSAIFLLYQLTSIIWIFLITALIFIILSIIGNKTKLKLNKLGTFLFILLLSFIILKIINIFLMNNTLNLTLCIFSLIIFMGYIFYDINRITYYYEEDDNMAILGAFQLYLDFINIFIRLIELFGKRRD